MSDPAMSVRKSVIVGAPREHVFDVFTTQFNRWWPRSHHIGEWTAFTAVMEPRRGGRWYERADDGRECEWGSVLEWQPPRRIVLAWHLDPDWNYDAAQPTEVEVTFTAESGTSTRVELEHRGLERFGERAEGLRAALGSDGGWAGLLQIMRAYAEQQAVTDGPAT